MNCRRPSFVSLAPLVLASVTSGCGLVQVKSPDLASAAPVTGAATSSTASSSGAPGATATSEAPKGASTTTEKASPDERQKEAAKNAERERARAEEARRKEAAKTQKWLPIDELGITIEVPGDVEAAKNENTVYGAPAFLLQGPESHFAIHLTNANSDRYGLDERIRAQQARFTYGIDVIKKESVGDGWYFEFSNPIFYQGGGSAGTDYGYFAQRRLGGKKFNCFISGLSDPNKVGIAHAACSSLKSGKP